MSAPVFGGSRWGLPAAAVMVSAAALASVSAQPGIARTAAAGSAIAVWAAALFWLVRSTRQAADRWGHLRRQWPTILGLAVPVLMPIVIVIGAVPRLSARRWLLAFASLVTTLLMTTAVLVLHFERGADEATITSLGDALWWAAVTATTVGYGDEIPVTAGGRAVGAGLLFVGVAVVSAGTASLTARVSRPDTEESDHAVIGAIEGLRHEVARLSAEVRRLTDEQATDEGPERP